MVDDGGFDRRIVHSSSRISALLAVNTEFSETVTLSDMKA